ncbi:hypothetical protein PPROV_000923100 [Pycnococcus provasolii]|uniref:Uncharacterized protein n=1 Tax=Pycnococcus provasolii TaxID=41880 RepID=A0A830HXH5_9CHLO|nr:hypothetical protein PPROV_000923100 [Pycnococcus provasolii]
MSSTRLVTVVFGASGGIGRALVSLLASSSSSPHHVLACGRSLEKLQTSIIGGTSSSLPAFDSSLVTFCKADATSLADVEHALKCAKDIAEQNDAKVHGAANCVGSVLLKAAHQTSDEDFHDIMRTNASSAFYVTRTFAKHLMGKGGGSIALCGSAVAEIGLPNHEAIAAAKGAVVGLTRSAAATYARKNVRVNAILPGLTITPMTERITSNESSRKASEKLHALGRLGEAEEVARGLAFFLDERNSFVTGQTLGVDGGLSTLHVPA